MHVQDNRAFIFSDSVLSALYRSEVFVMEVLPNDIMKAVTQRKSLDEGITIRQVLGQEDFEKLNERFLKEQSIDLDGIKANRLALSMQIGNNISKRNDDHPTFVDAYL